MCGERGGQSTMPIQVKIYCLKMIKIVLTLIYSVISIGELLVYTHAI